MGFNKLFIGVLIFLSYDHYSNAQISRFFIHLTDKDNTPFSVEFPEQFLSEKSIARRLNQGISIVERDLPVDPSYIDSISTLGANIIYTSKWMNAVYIEIDSSQISSVYSLGFVSDGFEAVRKGRSNKTVHNYSFSNVTTKISAIQSVPDYGVTKSCFELIGVDDMNSLGLSGEGITVAVFDAGFSKADTISFLSHLFSNSQIVATYDFVDNEFDVYDNGTHGLNVLSVLASNKEGVIVGGAYNSNYVLLRTENENQETIAEMIYWLIGAEYADSIGVDIINSSLGYNEFDDPSNNFQYSDLNGESTLITKAAEIASETGILVVSSAGNEGNVSWEKITAPADAQSVLAVGAVNSNGNYAPFSSRGPTFDGRIKPNVVAQGQSTGVGNPTGTAGFSNGTSFAAPQIASMAAGLWQAVPELTNQELKEIIERSAHQYNSPDEKLGYGIPNFLVAYNYGLAIGSGNIIASENKIFPNPFVSGSIYLILGQEEIEENVELQLVTVNGQVLFDYRIVNPEVSNRVEFNTEYLHSGFYFLRVKTKLGTTVHRLVKI